MVHCGCQHLDPASHAMANKEVQAVQFYTVATNGLANRWHGNVWLNPPFSQWKQWVPKIISEWENGDVTAMCILCASRTLTAQYFSVIHETCSAMCVMRGRIHFWGGYAGDSPDDGHVVFYFGRDVAAFEREFTTLGTVYKRESVAA